jgi:iturin family lipopeptide synthetase A
MNNSTMTEHTHESSIAIISMAGRFPGAKSIEEFWRNLRAGVESVSTFSDEELLAAGVSRADLQDPAYVRAKGMLDDIEMFDGAFFGFNPREAEITDPQHRLFLECAWEALERAGYDTQRYGGRIGVYGGAGISGYLLVNLATNLDLVNSVGIYQTILSNDKDYLSTRVSYKLNLKGPSLTVQTACSTSLVAVHLACQSLLSGECDMALAGGITITLPQKSGYQYQEGGISSPDGHCRPFDARAKGTLGGNGVGIVLLKRLDEALADGDIIHAVIRGSAINNDGSLKVGYTAPGLDGQSEVIVEAQAIAGVSADSISYVEAHGTATALGDPIEVAALSQAFRASTSRSHFCALGSVKSNFGHLDAAAGVAGLIKTVLALKHRELPPTLHYTAPNPEIDFAASPFYVNHELREWERQGETPRRAGVSSFGIGGTNAHLVVEEWPEAETAMPSARGWHLLVLSGRTAAAVTAATEKLRRHLEVHPDISLADVAYTLQVGRREFAQRRAVVCRDVEDAIEALSQPSRWIEGAAVASGSSSNISGSNGSGGSGSGGGSGRGAVLMYSGQGAQYVGMGRELYEREAVFRQTVDECAAAFEAAQGYDLREVLYPASGLEEAAAARLLETEVTQPALFVLEYALTRVWQAWGVRIEALMGHSIGEYVAACVAGVLSVEDGVRMVGRRGRLMQGMERGAMLAVRLSEAEVERWLHEWAQQRETQRNERSETKQREESEGVSGEAERSADGRGEPELWIAAVNGPQQCVLSGSEQAIAEAEARLAQVGVGVRRLATSHAFHSGMMREAAQALAAEMEGVARGSIAIPYISNVSGRWAQVEEVRGGEYWGRQMLAAVRWWRGVEEVVESGAGVLVEVGPGESLVGVVKEAVRGRGVEVLSTLKARRRVRSAGGAAAESGVGAESGRGSAAEGGEGAERGMVESLGQMWVRGVGVKWGGMYAGEARRRVELPTYEFERERYWVEARSAGAAVGVGIGEGGDESRSGESGAGAERKEAEVGKWLYVPVWKQSVGRMGHGTQQQGVRAADRAGEVGRVEGAGRAGRAGGVDGGQKWLVLREESGISEALIARLEAAGADVVSVSRGRGYEREGWNRYVIKGESREEYEQLVAELDKRGWRAERVAHLWSVTGAEEEDGDAKGLGRDGGEGVGARVAEFERMQERGFYSLLFLGEALSKGVRQEPLRINVVTSNAQRVTGLERLQPEKATVLGPCKVIGQEYPHIVCRSIDISITSDQVEGEYLVEQLALELSGEAADNVVAYRAFDRWVQIYEALPQIDESDASAGLREGGVYLITGGLGGVGMVLAEHLAESAGGRLVLTGRQDFPPRTEWQNHLDMHDERNEVSIKINRLLAMEAQGAELLILRADAGDAAQMREVVRRTLERFGALNGVIHAAGISGHQAFRTVPETTREEAAQHFRAKAHGLLVLEEVLAGLETDFCLLTSSLSTVLGGLGFAAYSAANSYMDAFAHKHNRRRMAGRWLSVDWDGWQLPQGTAEDEDAAFDPTNLSLTPTEGRDAFARLLSLGGMSQVVVSTGNLQARLDKWVSLGARRKDARAEALHGAHPRPVTLQAAYVAPRTEIEQAIAHIWEGLLGITPVGIHDDFFELGGHSLLATQVMSRLREELSIEISLRNLFDAATVAELAESVAAAMQTGQEPEAPSIRRVSREEDLPLSFAQQRLWFLDQLEPGSALYNIPVAVRLKGQLDTAALKQTLDEIVRRHEVLRTTFASKDGRAVQVVSPAVPLPLETIDLSASPADEREEQVERLAAREHQEPFDLSSQWSLRAKLVRLGAEEHIVLLTLHHIVSDAWSIGVLVQEVAALYEAFRLGQPSPLVELPIQYADFAAWQREWLQGEALDKQLNYWREQLSGVPAVLELPTDRPRPAVQTFHGKTHSHTMSKPLSEALRELSRQHETTLFMTLLAALNILLSRYSGQDDIVVGTTIANRNRLETERLIGFFVNTLVLRTDLSGDPTFIELLQRVREVSLGAYAHQDLPFEKLVEELQPERDLSRSPLTQIVFTLQNAPIGVLELPGLSLDFIEAKSPTSKFDIVVDVQDIEQSLFVEIQYNTDLFDESTIQRMMEHLETLLQSIAEQPSAPLAQLSLLTEAERRHLLLDWNHTAAPFPLSSCIHHLFEAQAQRSPHAIAAHLSSPSHSPAHSALTSLTFVQLDERANQLSHFLLDSGIGPQSVVALLLDHSCETLIAILGVLKAGCAYLPLDPSHPPARMAFALADAQAALLITTHSLHARLGAAIIAHLPTQSAGEGPHSGGEHSGNGSAPSPSTPTLAPRTLPPVLSLDTDWQRCASLPIVAPAIPPLPSASAAYLIYTSGSTGVPKGVVIEHASLVNYICWAQSVYLHEGQPSDCALYSSLAFDLTVTSLFLPLVSGHTIHLYPQHDAAPSLLEVMADNRVHLLKLTPSHLSLIRDLDNHSSHIRRLIVGGEALSTELAHAVSRSFGHRVEIYNEYGPTEATVGCMLYRYDAEADRRAWVPIGRPAANTQIYILDEQLEPTAEHVTGELYIGGAGVARGYLKRPDLSAGRFVPDPFSGRAGARLYRTGDRARRLADGTVEYLGRSDEQVKYHGYRVELNELRLALSAHARVRDAVVVVRRDGAGGREQLVGYYVGREAIDVEELRAHMQERVIAETVPQRYVHLRRLPLTLNGKVNVEALPAPWDEEEDGQRAGSGEGKKEGTGEARTPAEAQLVEIWREVLGRERVRIDDNFFELGGDSILSIQIIARANRAGLRLMPRQLFQHPTVAGLAAVAGTAQGTQSEQGEVSGEAPLTPIQRWFFAQELAVPAHYNQSLLLKAQRRLKADALQAAVRGVLRQHDALRLRFERGAEGEWRQWHTPLSEELVDQACTVIDLSGVGAEELGAAITAAAEEVQRSLDLRQGPMVRVVWMETGAGHSGAAQEGRLLIVAHHLVIDGVSWRVLLEDLERGYEQAERGQAVELGAKTASYREWGEALVAEAERGLGVAEEQYWTEVVRAEVTQIPAGGAGKGGGEERNARRVEVVLSAERTRELLQEVPAAYNTQINDVLVTALARTLSWWTASAHRNDGREGIEEREARAHNNGKEGVPETQRSAAVLVEMEGHGREEVGQEMGQDTGAGMGEGVGQAVDVSRTVGWFTSIYPVALEGPAEEDMGAALKRVKEQLRRVPRRGLGYGVLRYLGDREVSARLQEMQPAQVGFNYLGQLDRVVGEERWLAVSEESAGAEREGSGHRVHAVEVSGYVVGGELRMGWEYDGERYEREEMEGVAGRYKQELEELIAHCVREDAGGFTPSDFPDAELNQTELDELMGQLTEFMD